MSKSHSNYSLIINDYPTLFFSQSNNKITDINSEFKKQFGFSSEIIGKSIKKVIQAIFSDKFILQAEKDLQQEYAFLKIKDSHAEIAKIAVGDTKYDDTAFITIQDLIGIEREQEPHLEKVESSDLVFIVDSNGSFLQVNTNAYKTLGYSKSNILNMNIEDITSSSIQNYIYKKWDYLIQSNKTRGEHLLETKSGRILYSEYSFVANIRLGSHLFVFRVVNEVAPKRNVQQEVEQTMQAIDGVLDGVFFADSDFELRYVNEACIDILGYDEDKIIGKPIEYFCQSNEGIEKIKKILRKDGRWQGTIRAVQKDKTEIELEMKMTSLLKGSADVLWQGIIRDISDQIAVREDLARKESKFEGLLEAVPDGVIIVDENGIIQHSNSQIKEMLGYEEQELIGKRVEYLIPEPRKKEHVRYRQKFQKNPKKRAMRSGLELYAQHKDGSEVPVDIMLGPLKENGKKNTIAIIRKIKKFKDIHDRLEQEKEFIKLLHRLTKIANQNTRLNQTLSNSIQEICEYMNWPVGHVYLPADDGTQEFYPSDIWHIKDKERFRSFKKMTMCTRFKPGMGMVGEVIESGEPQWYSNAHKDPGFVRRMPDTDLNIRACFGLPILIKGEVVGVLEFFTDHIYASDTMLLKKMTTIGYQLGRVIERQNSEELIKKNMMLFKQLFDNIPVGVIVLDDQETIVKLNNSFSKIFGYFSNELVGKKLDNILVPEELIDNAKELNRKTFRGESVSRETVRKHKNGTKIPVFIHTVPIRIHDEVEAVMGIYVNLSEVKETEYKLRNSLEEKKFLLEEIHHRVKNNLAVITSLLELQIYQLDDEIIIKQLKDSQSRIYSMAMVHEQLYQLESFSYLELDIYLEELADKIKSTFKEPDMQVNLTFDTEPVKVNLDQAISCGQLINEIITNSFKHAFPNTNTGNIVISLTQQNGNVKLKISDDGQGMPKKELNSEHSSLGFKLIDTLTNQLQGEIEIDGSGGTTITVQFPKEEMHYINNS